MKGTMMLLGRQGVGFDSGVLYGAICTANPRECRAPCNERCGCGRAHPEKQNGLNRILTDRYHNLLAHREVIVEQGDEKFNAVAKLVTGKARDQIHSRWAGQYPQFREYQEKTTRKIPVIELEPHKA